MSREEALGWPARLESQRVVLRPLSQRDRRAWREVRQRNIAWLQPWDATSPPGSAQRASTFGAMVRRLRARAREGLQMPFAIEYDGRFVGQLTINNIVRGSGQFASVGYWIDQRYARRGITTRAVAMAIDHCMTTAGLHRIEICIRPENIASLRVPEKLGIAQYGLAPRFLHIDGEWRDHLMFAITAEEMPEGLLTRLDRREAAALARRQTESQKSHPSQE